MTKRPMSMLKRNEIKRLNESGKSIRAIAQLLNCSRKTVKKYLSVESDSCQESKLPLHESPSWIKSLNWDSLRDEHANKGVPLNVLWEEGREEGTIPVEYSGFWKQYNKRYPELPKTMVRFFKPGERIEIDYCDGIDILFPSTGETVSTHFFAASLCYSRYLYAEFTLSQKSEDFLNSHVRTFEFFGGVTATITPDNLKSGVSKAHRYDPDINPAYVQLIRYFGITATPARVRRPKDKPIVERTIQIFQKWFYFRVRKKIFTSLIELNKCLWEYLEIFHKKTHRIFKRTREEMFAEEKNYLIPLPVKKYDVRIHKRAKVHYDCHLQFQNNYYSAPWKLRGKNLDVWASDKIVEIFNNGDCVAVHNRSISRGKLTKTNKDHYPPEHKAYLEITPDYLRKRAKHLGENVFILVDRLMKVDHPLRYIRRCQGLVSLAKKYTSTEIDTGCEQALIFEKYNLRFIENVIKNHKANKIENEDINITRSPNSNMRGLDSYH